MILICIFAFIMIINAIWLVIGRNNNWIGALSALAIVVLMAGNNTNPDYHNYSMWYIQFWYPSSVEKGYVKAANYFSSHGFSYHMFLFILFAACALIIGYVVIKLHVNVHAVILMFCAYQIFFDYIQIRNAVSVALLVAAIYFCTKNKRIIAAGCIIASALFHISMIVYLPILFIPKKKEKTDRLYIYYIAAILFFCALTFFNGNRFPFFGLIKRIKFIDAAKIEKYFTTSTSLGFVIPFALQFANVLMITISDNIIQAIDISKAGTITGNNKFDSKALVAIKRYSAAAKGAIVLSCFAFPLVMLNEEFVRFFRNGNMLLYIEVGLIIMLCSKHVIGKRVKPTARTSIDYQLYLLMVAATVLLWIILYTPQGIVRSFFAGNYFI